MNPIRKSGARRIKTLQQLEQQVFDWNAKYPIGTKVEFFFLIHPFERSKGIFATRTKAEILGGHTAVVWLEGYSGCVAIEACVPMEASHETNQ